MIKKLPTKRQTNGKNKRKIEIVQKKNLQLKNLEQLATNKKNQRKDQQKDHQKEIKKRNLKRKRERKLERSVLNVETIIEGEFRVFFLQITIMSIKYKGSFFVFCMFFSIELIHPANLEC